jgi:hypothetical protein
MTVVVDRKEERQDFVANNFDEAKAGFFKLTLPGS